MSDYAWICLKIPEHGGMWVNTPFLIIIPCVLLNAWLLISTFTQNQKLFCILEEHKAVFLMRQNLIFSIVAGSIWFNFCFRLNVFTTKISKFFITFEGWELRELDTINLDIPTVKSWTNAKHWNQTNRGHSRTWPHLPS